MIYGYARVSSDGQSVTAQAAALRKHGAGKVFREVASGAKTEEQDVEIACPGPIGNVTARPFPTVALSAAI